MSVRRYALALAIVCLAAWVFRAAMTERFVGLASAPDPADGLDQLDYELLAHRMSLGEGYTLADGAATARRAPGTSLLILPAYLLFGRSFFAARLWFALLSALTCWVGAELVRPRWGTTAALLTAGAIAVNPGLFYYSMFLWSEAPVTFFVTLATWLTLRAMREEGTWCAPVSGLAWGLSILLRPQVVLIAPWAGLLWLLTSSERRWPLFRLLAAQAVCAAAVVAPWVVRNAVVMGKPCLATLVGGHTFWGAHNRITLRDPAVRGEWLVLSKLRTPDQFWPDDEVGQEAASWRYAFEELRADPAKIPPLVAAKLYRFLSPFETTTNRAVYWAFAALWMLTLPWLLPGMRDVIRRDPELAALIGVQLAATVTCVLIFYGTARFRHVHEPLFMAVSSVGVLRVGGWCWNWWTRSSRTEGREACRGPGFVPIGREFAVESTSSQWHSESFDLSGNRLTTKAFQWDRPITDEIMSSHG